jgi:hypothetical protein
MMRLLAVGRMAARPAVSDGRAEWRDAGAGGEVVQVAGAVQRDAEPVPPVEGAVAPAGRGEQPGAGQMVQVTAADAQVGGRLIGGAQMTGPGRLHRGGEVRERLQGAAVIQRPAPEVAGHSDQAAASQFGHAIAGHHRAQPGGQHLGGADRAQVGHVPAAWRISSARAMATSAA